MYFYPVLIYQENLTSFFDVQVNFSIVAGSFNFVFSECANCLSIASVLYLISLQGVDDEHIKAM